MRGWCHSCQLLHHSWRWKVQGEEKCFSTENQFFLAFLTFEKALLWLSRWGGGVTRANFCITRGSLSWLVAPRDAKVGTRDTTPSPLEPQQSLFKGLEGQKELIFSGKTFFLTLDFSSPLMMQKFALVTPPPQLSCHKKAFSKVLKAKKNWFSAENHFALPQTFHVALTNIVKYYFQGSERNFHCSGYCFSAEVNPYTRGQNQIPKWEIICCLTIKSHQSNKLTITIWVHTVFTKFWWPSVQF